MRRELIALLGVPLVAAACGGGEEIGARVERSDLAIHPYGRQTDLHFDATCPAGRLTIEFQPKDKVTIRNGPRLIATVSEREAFIGCLDAKAEEPPLNQGWLFRRFATTGHPTKLVCRTEKRIDISVSTVYKYEYVAAGLNVVVSTRGTSTPVALVGAGFEEGEESRLSFHAPRCRIGPDG